MRKSNLPVPRMEDKTSLVRSFPLNVDRQFIEDIWQQLRNAIRQIHRKNNSELCFEELYRKAYTMVLHKHGEQLYIGLREEITRHLEVKVREDVLASINNNFLQTLNQAWIDHHTSMVMIRDIFMYMDRVYLQNNNRESIYNMGLVLFLQKVVRHEAIKTHLRETLLDLILKERRGEMIDRPAFKNACKLLMTLGVGGRSVYEDVFENEFLNQSVEFYSIESQQFLAENNASVYIRQVETRIEEEVNRSTHYLDPSTEPRILKVLETELIEKHMKTVAEMENSGVVHMLSNNNMEDLACMYKLFGRVEDGHKTIATCLSSLLRAEGKAIVQVQNPSSQGAAAPPPLTAVVYIQNLLDLKDQYDGFLKSALNSDIFFKRVICGDFEYFLNLNSRSPEYLSLFIDYKLKNGFKGITDAEVETLLGKVINLFRFVEEKDSFELYYKRHLANRLLNHKSGSDESEKLMISKLKTECGCQFTSKLEGMFKDIALSTTLNEDFKEHLFNSTMQLDSSQSLESTSSLDSMDMLSTTLPFGEVTDINVRVLTTGNWPGQTAPVIINLPQILAASFEVFKNFYLGKHSGRVLTLQPTNGTADLKAIFYDVGGKSQPSNETAEPSNSSEPSGQRKHIICVSTFQMCLLLLFNTKQMLTYEEIKDKTAIPDRELVRALLPMYFGKSSQRILIKNPQTKEVKPYHTFQVNDDFSSPLHRIVIRQVSTRHGESETERTATTQKVEEDRRFEIEACIVRIMKSRKKIKHNQLIAELVEQVSSRFHPNLSVIKNRIETLIDRDYMERAEDDKETYLYKM